ncbi:MAG: phosphatase PAP2 family protein [Bacteroidetes bacterium]|jgi:membrane-associated phospholipid phosphatase|nr:phosphatase PAP2 family protein [Bacteroidota bacterium]MBK7039646.1 phosphatase PAP2 family protein [Bacteroidota bacterium]MBK9301659.1 phosphatase PAP2 family protein [Bacteroidota bacterium]MBK9481701.1 phosphatase PAP2 family protein [Bacteroidota bacterium]HQW46881.1 phosphatase PAP2 family protein [Chitinophagaceae bacterium]
MGFIYKSCLLYTFLIFSFQSHQAQNADIQLLRKINVQRNTRLDASMQLISNTEAYIGIGLPVSVVIASYIKHDKILFQQGVNMCLALGASSVSTFILKRIVNRTRPGYTYPDIVAFENERSYSFPSGHTSNAFCTATSLSLHFKKWYVVIPSFLWAGTVGYSRMHLGVHYPSDVLAGALLGAGSAYATYKVNKMLKQYFAKKYPKSNTLVL